MNGRKLTDPLQSIIDKLSSGRIPALQLKYNQFVRLFEKSKNIYSPAQIRELFSKEASDIFQARNISVRIGWPTDVEMPIIFGKVRQKLEEMEKDLYFLKKEKANKEQSVQIYAIMNKYINREHEETFLMQDMDIFGHILREMNQSFETEVESLNYNEFISTKRAEMKPHIARLDELGSVISASFNNVERSDITDQTLLEYQYIAKYVILLQDDIKIAVESKVEDLNQKIELFRVKYQSAKLNLAFAKSVAELKELSHLSDECLQSFKHMNQAVEYQFLLAKNSSQMSMRESLMFLKENVLSKSNMLSGWSNKVKTLSFRSMFMGGTKVSLVGGGSAVVPHGIGRMYELLSPVELHTADKDIIEILFKQVYSCAESKVAKRNVCRHEETSNLYRSIVSHA